MKAVIYTDAPTVSILGKPLLQWQIEKCRENKIEDITLIHGSQSNEIRNDCQNESAFANSISYSEAKRTPQTIQCLTDLPRLTEKEDILFINGTTFWDVDIARMADFHRKKQSVCTCFIHPTKTPSDSALLILDESNRITGIDSNRTRSYWYDNLVDAGLYIINGKIFETIKIERSDRKNPKISFFHALIDRHESVYGYRSPEYVKDVITAETIRIIEQDIKSGYVSTRNLRKEQKCIFLDRDGTVNVRNGLVDTEDKLSLEACAAAAVRKINQSEYLAILVTNQAVVAKGMCTMEEVRSIHRKLATLLGEEGAYLDDIAFCPHHPEKGEPGERPEYKFDCDCRKPKTGMLTGFAEQYHINLKESWMIGDTTRDMLTGNNAGTHTALVLTGDAGKDGKYQAEIELICENLLRAVEMILGKA